MSASRTKFYLDKQNGKILGVCAGIADYTGIDVLFVRIATVLLTFMTGYPILLYFVVAWIAENKPYGLYENADKQKFWQGVRTNPKGSTAEVRSKFRDIDRRLADIETLYTSRNQRLADEIDRLR